MADAVLCAHDVTILGLWRALGGGRGDDARWAPGFGCRLDVARDAGGGGVALVLDGRPLAAPVAEDVFLAELDAVVERGGRPPPRGVGVVAAA